MTTAQLLQDWVLNTPDGHLSFMDISSNNTVLVEQANKMENNETANKILQDHYDYDV